MGEPSNAEYWDGWYADMAEWSARDEIVRRCLGLPEHLPTTGSLPYSALDVLAQRLHLASGSILLDLACGRGGLGLEVARMLGASLVGIDVSAEAARQATRLAADLGRQAEFRVGDLIATGLDDASVDGVLCVDSVQFAASPSSAYVEMLRVLRPGGRAVLTCWEAVDRDDDSLPERIRSVDLASGLTAAGFVDVGSQQRVDWHEAEHAMWREAAALDPGDDPALRSFHEEGRRVLARWGSTRRVLASGTAPSSSAHDRDRPASVR